MSLALHQEVKRLRHLVEALEARVLLLEMQKRPVEPVGVPIGMMDNQPRPKITLPRKAAA